MKASIASGLDIWLPKASPSRCIGAHSRSASRISRLTLEEIGYPRSRAILLKEWRATQQIPQPQFIADRN